MNEDTGFSPFSYGQILTPLLQLKILNQNPDPNPNIIIEGILSVKFCFDFNKLTMNVFICCFKASRNQLFFDFMNLKFRNFLSFTFRNGIERTRVGEFSSLRYPTFPILLCARIFHH